MKRLDFVLPEWTRIIWNSKEAKDVWEPKIQKISNAFLSIEKKTVLSNLKPAWLTILSESAFHNTINELKDTDFVVHILAKTPVSNTYSSSSQQYVEGQPFNYRVVLTHKDLIVKWEDAWKTGNNDKIGELLGFPKCCREFFQKYWIEEKFLDTSWVMSHHGTAGPKECNILLRWLGVRAVSHLPCSFDCEDTYVMARRNIEWGYANGFTQEMEWLEEMLDWPVQWSALHGIAEIRTPILKISTRTDATAELVVVNKEGFGYPKEGASGTKFPYKNKAKSIITQNNAFKRSLLLDKQWKDNGFASFEGMSHSHQVLLNTIDILDKDEFYNVIDFGCGNAELLKSIQQIKLKNSKINGIEVDSDRFSRIKYNTVNLNYGEFYNKNMFDLSADWINSKYDLVILMPGRLLECSKQDRVAFLNWLTDHSKFILWYGYGDWISKNLSELTRTMDELDIELKKINTVSSDICFASICQFVQKQRQNIQFQILS